MKEETIKSLIDTLQTALIDLSVKVQEQEEDIKDLNSRMNIHNSKINELEGFVFPFGE